MNDALIRIENIKNKLEKLKNLDSNFSAFGSKSHEYELNNKLTLEDIEKYQNENNVILPEEYILFLIHIGNGGVGPCYGLFPLEENENKINLSEEFPYNVDTPFYLAGKYDELNKKINECETLEEEDVLFEEHDRLLNIDYSNSTKGIIDICHEGCGIYDVLVVNGNTKGTMWLFDFANDFGVAALINPKNGQIMHFLDWYELWLDEQLEFFTCKSEEKDEFGSYVPYVKGF